MNDAFLEKAKRTIRWHSLWWMEKGRQMRGLQNEFSEQYNCYPDALAHAFEQADRNGFCPVCHCAYPSVRDITLDIWGSEWSVMCRRCNSRRGDKTPEQWEIYKLRFKLQSEVAFVNTLRG
jgi:hypothetical protein